MAKLLKKLGTTVISSVIFTTIFVMGILLVQAWSGPDDLTASNGDDLTEGKWNNLVEQTIKTNGSVSTTTNGVYCGQTPSTNGSMGGYSGVKAMCETACGDPLAHMCSSQEIINSHNVGLSVPGESWYSSMIYNSLSGRSIYDCNNWTSALTTHGGARLNNTAAPSWHYCENTYPVVCCK